MDTLPITSSPDIMRGKPTIRGTRLTVEYILEELASGRSVDELVDAHPRLTRAGVQAALKFAAERMKSEVVVPPRAA